MTNAPSAQATIKKMKGVLIGIAPKYASPLLQPTDHEVYKNQLALLCALYNNTLDQKYEELLCGITILLYRNGGIKLPLLKDDKKVTEMAEKIATEVLSHWTVVFPLRAGASEQDAETDLNRRRVVKRLVQSDTKAALKGLQELGEEGKM